jgi:hypothetical protein
MLAGPAGRGRAGEAREALDSLALSIVPLGAGIATRAVEPQGLHRSLRLSRALVAATADVLGADILLTTDRRLARIIGGTLVGQPGPGTASPNGAPGFTESTPEIRSRALRSPRTEPIVSAR